MKQKNTRVPANGLYPPKAYSNTHVYIMDDVDPDAPAKKVGKKLKIHPHTFNCNSVRDFFNDHTECHVHSVRFQNDAKGKDVFAYWKDELETKTADDLLIIYFHGQAGGEEETYKWALSQHPKTQINAYNLIKLLNDSNAECLFLLDCFIHTRITNKWKRVSGNTEIIARPDRMHQPDGKVAEHDSDFTSALITNLDDFITRIDEEEGFKGYKAMKSIPELMARDTEMYSNPQRIWLSRTAYGEDKVVVRFKVDPCLIRQTGKMEFFAVQIQGEQVDGVKESSLSGGTAEGTRMPDAQTASFTGEAVGDMGDFEDEDDEDGGDSTLFIGD
ncbi:hypothetical protein LTR37_005895 [Vermiconidia calcicola]|uniref:Uncharacterized protein n=1 Tax=Vermiconidia calcicola TaxID=1690605 RepID=A0ACC3NI08_9PEZI|nr:hypothetical protein LTR37_005895 [Vermiconidia calcicola]